MDKTYYITTPIYYPSAKPHMGHAYSSIISDFFARFKKIDDYQVHFLTGTDEHGLKIQRSAEKAGKEPLVFCDQISQTFRDLSNTLNLSNTDFIELQKLDIKKQFNIFGMNLRKMMTYIYQTILDCIQYQMKLIIMKTKLKNLMEKKLQYLQNLLLNGLKKNLIFLDFQSGKNRY